MSNRPGRNDPCPCGSGKKYKRCCLTSDEAAAREHARQQTLFDHAYGAPEFDANDDDGGELDDGEELFDIEDVPALDVRAITRVCYTRGVVRKLSDLRSGRGVTVSEWQAPEIPQEVLDSIEREAIDALEGEWGDPKAGDPMQVDVIDLETANDIVSIEVFNRAIFLAHEEREEIQRIHRVCGVLEAATSGGSAQLPEEREPTPTFAELPREDVSQAPAAFDLSSVLKEHRRQGGACALCGKAMTRQSAQKHLATCAPMHDVADGAEQRLVHIRATAPGLPAYWLDCEVRRSAKLEALDSFLRRIWLECCGHLSAFKIGDVSYFSDGYDFGFARALGGFGRPRNERAMNVRLDEALPGVGGPFEYEYDFGSTSSLQLKLVSERVGRVGRQAVRLLARNTPPVWPCAICGQPADVACAYCFQEDTNAFVCKRHRRQHACGEDEGFLPVVNSPRMGICGYTART